MATTLKDIINCYKKNLLKTPNIQAINKIFSNEEISFTDNLFADGTLSSSTFKNSRLTDMKFTIF